MKLTPKNWAQFQHYKDRSPPWIKLHKALLDDRVFQRLPDASRALAPCLWLLASEGEGGVFDGSVEEVSFRVRQSEKWTREALKPLIDNGFFVIAEQSEHDASEPLADRLQGACLETEAETEKEKDSAGKPARAGFDDFYAAYPRKVKPVDARKAWDKLKPDAELLARMLRAIDEQKKSPQWQKDGGQYIPYPATWLNAGEWENQTTVELATPSDAPIRTANAVLAELNNRAAEVNSDEGRAARRAAMAAIKRVPA